MGCKVNYVMNVNIIMSYGSGGKALDTFIFCYSTYFITDKPIDIILVYDIIIITLLEIWREGWANADPRIQRWILCANKVL